MKPIMIFGIVLLCVLTACQGERQQIVEELTDAQRQEIEAAVRNVIEDIFAAARETDAERLFAHHSTEDGMVLMQASIYRASEVQKSFRESWNPDRPDRLERQEMDDQEIEVMAITPNVALAAITTQEVRGYRATEEVFRGRFANFFVLVLEEGQWKVHSGQQASWPIE
jgi:hypothetical protein